MSDQSGQSDLSDAQSEFTIPPLLFNGSNRCEVAKLSFCSEDVKTAALPPCEVASDGGGKRCEVAKLSFCSEDVKTAALPPCEVAPDGGGCV